LIGASFSCSPTPFGTRKRETRFGDFDCVGAIDGSRADEDLLLEGSVQLELDGRQLRVIGLGELLQIKKRASRPKGLAGIPYIEATIAELPRQK
jgi:hypothetical protein